MNAANKLLLGVALFTGSFVAQASPIGPFISEIHYDNVGADRDEFVAVSGPGDFDWTGWQLVFYNGSDGRDYATVDVIGPSGAAAEWTEIATSYAGIQNGPDGVALVSPDGVVAEFVAYEGAFSGSRGAADGHTARLLPVSEVGVAAGLSLQRSGRLAEFDWTLADATPGRINEGLVLGEPAVQATVSVPAVWMLCLAGLMVASIRTGNAGFKLKTCRTGGM
ncbi:MAG: hypothetical protein KDI82_14830 [Gammaproteobacteria bacterium]|nr:hypothetical protein [Gammaproteobacteria bacterium]